MMDGKCLYLKSNNHSAIFIKDSHYDKSDACANTHSEIYFGKTTIDKLTVESFRFSTIASFHANVSCSAKVDSHSKITSSTMSPSCKYSEMIGTFSSIKITRL
jgi:hypothetical protein